MQRIALVRIGTAHSDDRGPAVQFHLGDHLGSSNVVVDSGGSMVNREEFTPYGETSFGSFARKRYRFTGKERDEESGLNYHGARYYAPSLVRWLSSDPTGINDGVNTYSYVQNRPTTLSDPGGTDSQAIGVGACSKDDNEPTNLDYRKLRSGSELAAELPSVYEQTEGAQERQRIYQQSYDAQGATTTQADRDTMADDFLHPSKRIAKNTKTMAVVGAQALVPEYYFAARSIYHSASGDPEAAVWDLGQIVLGRLLGGGSKEPEPIAPTGTGRRPDFVPVHEIIPIGRNKTAPRIGSYRGVTRKNQLDAQKIGTKYSGPGRYDAGHRTPLSQVPPGDPIKLRAELRSTNRGDGASIAKSNAARRSAGLYVRPDPDQSLFARLAQIFFQSGHE
jgi:RHS repeat-associated protein